MPRAYVRGGIRIASVGAVVSLLVYAFLVRGDTGFTFATGSGTGSPGIELLIDSSTYYNGVFQPGLSWGIKDLTPGVDHFFNFGDVKPGDSGTSTISMHVRRTSAYICLDFMNLTDEEHGMNEPEALVDSSEATGELGEGLEFFGWQDDGDEKFEVGEKPLFGTTTQSGKVVLNDTTYTVGSALYGAPITPNFGAYVGIYWCAGNLTVNTATGAVSCDGTFLGNEAQTDSMSVDVRIRAIQGAGNPGFSCTPVHGASAKGNNGHGNDADGNDDSNPGHANDLDDDTDDDGLPPGFEKKTDEEHTVWHVVEKKSYGTRVREFGKYVITHLTS